ncbi:Mitochondrial fission protein [Emydomyces testavorans]|uniref:Mitochondrial fission protein n=1 Tax=Emydomyces testavorans TaxID=2070801 RepID=A0AAF0DE24_9EURO|nr:Mitochondrial fission protein [Emydomyces testavorans]
MAGSRRLRSGRSVSQDPAGQQSQQTGQSTVPPADQKDSAAQLNPSPGNPLLPGVQAQHSFVYGVTASPSFPRQLRTSPPTGATQVGVDLAQRSGETKAHDFERIEGDARANPGTGRITRFGTQREVNRKSASPTRRGPGRRPRTREVTPDDQLLGSLREVSEEAEERKERIFPSIEESSVSWNTERHVIGYPQSSRATDAPVGSFHQGQEQGGVQGSARPITDPPLRPFPSSQPLANPRSSARVRLGPGSVASVQPAPQLGTIPVLNPSQQESEFRSAPAPRKTPLSSTSLPPPLATRRAQRRCSISRIAIMLMILLLAVGGLFARFDDLKAVIPRVFSLSTSFCGAQPAAAQYAEAFNKFSAGVDQRLMDMSREMAAIKDEWNKRLPHLKQAIWPEVEDPLLPRRINWFSTGLGALVDPYLTTSIRPGLLARSTERAAGTKRTNPPAAALTRWDEHGDCWCVPDHPSEIQLAVLLGRPLVPEEVVVEHIQKEATLDPESAPRDMELWVEYVARSEHVTPSTIPGSKATATPSAAQFNSPADARAAFSAPLSPSQREDIVSTLRMVYPDEPETAYSDDTNLGANYYRVGKFQYDINGKHNIQRFQLDAVIDLTDVRVKQAVVRVKSNWGSKSTCLYRVRLHGHM